MYACGDQFVSSDNEGSIILWAVRDENEEGLESLVEKRVAISGMGSVQFALCINLAVI